jgi:hypothetical protein
MSFQPFCEFWRRCWCPACNAANWLYDSHSQRAYPSCPEACECHGCGHKFYLGDQSDFEDMHAGELEDSTIEQVFEDYVVFEKGKITP